MRKEEEEEEEEEEEGEVEEEEEPRRPDSKGPKGMASLNARGRKKTRAVGKIILNVSNCKYESVRMVAERLNWALDEEPDEFDTVEAGGNNGEREAWNVFWTDTSVSAQRAMRLKRFQKLNHFPGMSNLARKGGLGRNLTRLAKLFPTDFDFFPQTWVLPAQWKEFKEQIDSGKGNRTFIIKPDASCQGKGIFLTRTYENVNSSENQVAQRYLHKPLLIDEYKFDMRVYIVVTNVNPLRMFMFEDGLIRICTEKYVEPKGKNLSKSCMHLTNYAINKNSEKFVFNQTSADNGVGNKRSLLWFWGWLRDTHGEEAVTSLKRRMNDMAIKTLISVQPLLAHTYTSCVARAGAKMMDESFSCTQDMADGNRTLNMQQRTTLSNCFEILGFDVLVDRNFKPWLIEVNHSPSFAIDTPLDKDIKTRLIEKTLRLINVTGNDKKRAAQLAKRNAQSRLYATPPLQQQQQQQGADGTSVEALIAQELARQLRCEEKETKDGSLEMIYPPTNEAQFNHYQPYFEASQRIFQGRATGSTSAQSRRKQMGMKGDLSPRSRLRLKAIQLNAEDDGQRQQDQRNISTDRFQKRPEVSSARLLLSGSKREEQESRKVKSKFAQQLSRTARIDLEAFRRKGMQRRSIFNTYLRDKSAPTSSVYPHIRELTFDQ